MRTILICAAASLVLTPLAACQANNEPLIDDTEGAADSVAMLSCALGDETAFTESCSLQRLAGATRTTIVLGRGDSGFRRFTIATDGRGLVTADGAEPARVTIIGNDAVEVAVGLDRYRLPAEITGAAPPPDKAVEP